MSATEFYQKSKASVIIHKMIIWKCINGTLIVALGGIVAGLADENWSQMDGQSRFLFVCGVLLSCLKSVDMLFDQTLSKIQQPSPVVQQPTTPIQ